jgi:protease I
VTSLEHFAVGLLVQYPNYESSELTAAERTWGFPLQPTGRCLSPSKHCLGGLFRNELGAVLPVTFKENTMTTALLQGMRVAILVRDGFLESELLEPKRALENAGAATFVVSGTGDRVRGRTEKNGQKDVPVDIPLNTARAEDFHALLLPGGRSDQSVNIGEVQFVRHFMKAGKLVAAIGDGCETLLQAGTVRGCTMTSDPSLKSELENAGTIWVDNDVVCDRNLITSRTPDDIPAFNREMIRSFAEFREHSISMRKVY